MDITFENVSYTYQAKTPFSHQAIQDVSFQIPSGSFVAIVGHTGSGKSTLIQHINGLLVPTEGRVRIGDYTLRRGHKIKNMKEMRSQIGVVFQYPEHQLFEETVEKDIAFGPENFGVTKEEIKYRIANILPKVGLNKDFLQRSPFELSGGQMRRVAIAGVLAVEPKVLVLDEPTAGLDPRGQTDMMETFYRLHQEQNLTTVLVTHYMEHALQYADHVIILNEGHVYLEGEPTEVFTNETTLKKVKLDIPEVMQFLKRFSEKFAHTVPYHHQSLQEIAQSIQTIVNEVDSS